MVWKCCARSKTGGFRPVPRDRQATVSVLVAGEPAPSRHSVLGKTAEEGPMSRYGAATEAVRRRSLRVLFVEDMPTDVKLCLRELTKAGFEVTEDVVQTPEEFLERIRAIPYDIILSDQRLPKWTGTEALECVQQEGIDIPFILVTGTTLGEEAAVECIKKGASDYVLKDRLARLPVAISQA